MADNKVQVMRRCALFVGMVGIKDKGSGYRMGLLGKNEKRKKKRIRLVGRGLMGLLGSRASGRAG